MPDKGVNCLPRFATDKYFDESVGDNPSPAPLNTKLQHLLQLAVVRVTTTTCPPGGEQLFREGLRSTEPGSTGFDRDALFLFSLDRRLTEIRCDVTDHTISCLHLY